MNKAPVKYFSRDNAGAYGTQLDSTTSVLKLDWDLSRLHLRFLSSYSRQNHRFLFDIDISPVPLAHLSAFEQDDAFAQELQLSPLDRSAALDWIVGTFYLEGFAGFNPVTFETLDAMHSVR